MKGWRECAADIFAKHGEIEAKMKSAPGPGTTIMAPRLGARIVSVSPSAMRTTRPVSDAAGRRISLGFDAQGDAPSSVRPYDAADALGRAKSTGSMRGHVPVPVVGRAGASVVSGLEKPSAERRRNGLRPA